MSEQKKIDLSTQTGNKSSAESSMLSPDELDYYSPDKKTGIFKKFRRWFSTREYSYLVYAFIIPVLLNYFIYLAMEIHPFGNGSVLVLDLNGQYVYFYEALRNAVNGETSLLYSFARALGGEFLGIYAYYLASPFSYIVCLFPQENILDALLCIFLLKTGITGVTMGYYLHKISSKANKISIVTFSILYSLCSYAVVQQHNSMWIDALMWLPLLTLGIEQLIKNKKYKLFVIMLALTLMSNFYIGYMACIYTVAYFFYYYFAHNENGKNNPTGEPNHFSRSFLRIAGSAAIGAGISMVIVISAYYSLQFGKNTFSNPNFDPNIRFDLLDFFTKFLPGSYDTVRPEGLPFLYCGILTLFCVPIYFMSKKFSNREKIASASILIFFVLSFFINTLDMIWHGFQKPNWLNYRYSFMVCFLLLVMAYKGYGEIRKASGKTIATLAAIFVLFLGIVQKFTFHSYANRVNGSAQFDQKLEQLETIWFSLICFVLFGILLCAAIKTRHRENVSLIICILVCLEVFCNGLCNCLQLGDDVIYSSYSSYTDFIEAIRPVSNEIIEQDTDFYRFEKTAHRKYGDNMAFNMRGLTNSTSTLNADTIKFLANLGYASRSHWSKYLGGNPVSDSLLGIRYIIANAGDNLDLYYDLTDIEPTTYKNKEYSTYYNHYALSLAYAVNDLVTDFKMTNYTSPMFRLNDLVTAMTGSEEHLDIFKTISFTVNTSNCNEGTQGAYFKYTPASPDSNANVTYTFSPTQDGEVFFFLPCDQYGREVKLTLSGIVNGKRENGKDMGTFNASETTRIVSLGKFMTGDQAELTMTLKADVLYVKKGDNQKLQKYYDALYYIDMDVFEDAFSKLGENQLAIKEGWKAHDLSGTITTANDDQMILTTLAYDEGWVVTVDGKKVDTFETLDALVAFRIDTAGDHTVRLKYSPKSFTLGLTISILSLLLFILIVIFEKPLCVALAQIAKQTESDNADSDDYDGDYFDVEVDVGVDAGVNNEVDPGENPNADPCEHPLPERSDANVADVDADGPTGENNSQTDSEAETQNPKNTDEV